MKYILLLLLFLIPVNASCNSADAMIVMDMNSKRVLYSKDIHQKRPIASITKIMTAIIAIESNLIEDDVKVDDIVLKAYGSGIYLSIGEHMSLEDMIYGLMLRSGNDAALMIAKYVGGSEEEFVNLMNDKASKLGMNNTTFNNASGLDDKGGNISTCYDMALLTSYAMENDLYKKIVSTKRHIVKTDIKTYDWYNKNRLLSMYKYTTGGKTGFTDKARRTLVTTASKNNLDLVIVTLNDGNDFSDHMNYYEDIFNNYTNYLIVDSLNFVIDDKKYDDLYINNSIYYPLREDEKALLSTNVKIYDKSSYQDNEKVGILEIYLDEKKVLEEDIYASKKKINFTIKKFIRFLLGFIIHD